MILNAYYVVSGQQYITEESNYSPSWPQGSKMVGREASPKTFEGI